jgi:hypothetical protein
MLQYSACFSLHSCSAPSCYRKQKATLLRPHTHTQLSDELL